MPGIRRGVAHQEEGDDDQSQEHRDEDAAKGRSRGWRGRGGFGPDRDHGLQGRHCHERGRRG